jgi:hypothetical protein
MNPQINGDMMNWVQFWYPAQNATLGGHLWQRVSHDEWMSNV